ncbi:MAG: hypothetical protein AB8B59_09140 [Maribacter sp.]
MVLIRKWWARLIFSLVLAAVCSEAVTVISKGKLNYNAFIAGIALYLILSVVYGFKLRNERKEEQKQ